MKKNYGAVLLYCICGLLTVAAFFATDIVLFDFHLEPTAYSYRETDRPRPASAVSDVWFDYGDDGMELLIGVSDELDADSIQLYALTAQGSVAVDAEDMSPIRSDLTNFFIAALPERIMDIDGDGKTERVLDFARADIGEHAFNPAPQAFHQEAIPFELVFAERNLIRVFYHNEPLTTGEIVVTSADGTQHTYQMDDGGWISGLPIRDIREGFTAAYTSEQDQTVYRMSYALEDYPYFSAHFWKAQLPLLWVFALAAIGIALVQVIRTRRDRKNPASGIYGRERPGFYTKNPLQEKTSSRFMLVRWLCMLAGMFSLTYLGKLLGQGQLLSNVAVPVFACPFNMDQIVEPPCYYLSHLPNLLLRGGADFPARGVLYTVVFSITLLLVIVFLGRILCGFLCPAGLLQDVLDKVRQALHIRPITVTDRMNKILQPVTWLWIVLFLGFFFVGGDFCNICPLKVFNTAQGGFWTNLVLGGFLSVVILVGSFFIRRFWCLMCPLGYIMGLFHRFNLFKLKKDCTACTECGGCYEACPMRLKNIYTEREKADVQTVDCLMCGECIHKCPESDALSMTFCGKKVYRSDRKTYLSRYQAVGKGTVDGEKKDGDSDE